MTLLRKTALSIAISLSVASSPAMATDTVVAAAVTAVQGAVVASQAAIAGAVSTMQGYLAQVEQAIGLENIAKIQSLGDATITEMKAQEVLQANLAKTQMMAARDLAVAGQVAEAKRRAIELYGDQGTNVNCDTASLGQSVAAGRAAMISAAASSGASMEKRARSGPGTEGSTKKAKDLLTIAEEDITDAVIYPPSGTLTPENKAKVEIINQHIIDPFPPNKLNDKQKDTPIGVKHEAIRLTMEASKASPRRSQNVVQSMKTANFPISKWVEKEWAAMGNTGPIPGTSSDPAINKGAPSISYNTYVELMIKSRIDNPEWYTKASATMNDVWQLREINMTSALSLEIQYRQLRMLEALVEMQAQARANDVDKEYGPQLDEARTLSESAQ